MNTCTTGISGRQVKMKYQYYQWKDTLAMRGSILMRQFYLNAVSAPGNNYRQGGVITKKNLTHKHFL